MNNHKDNNFNKVINLYLDECRFTRRLSEATLKSYSEALHFFTKILPEIQSVEDINTFIINEFFKRISSRERIVGRDEKRIGLKQSTVLSYFTRLFTFFKWIESHNYIPAGSITSKIKKPVSPKYDNPLSLNKDEISQIISAITFRNIENDFLQKRDLVIISILLYTGIRRGELLGLRISDIDFENRQIEIRAETSKSKKSRTIPLHPKLILVIKNYLKYRKTKKINQQSLFVSENNTPFTEFGLKHWVKRYVSESGIHFHVHRFRHTFACTMAKNGADIISIRNMLGHSTTKMTERYLRSIKSEHSRHHIETLSF